MGREWEGDGGRRRGGGGDSEKTIAECSFSGFSSGLSPSLPPLRFLFLTLFSKGLSLATLLYLSICSLLNSIIGIYMWVNS